MMMDGDDDVDVSTSSTEDERSNTQTTPVKSNLGNNRQVALYLGPCLRCCGFRMCSIELARIMHQNQPQPLWDT